MANSSPPSRAIRSLSGPALAQAVATSFSSASPIAWPSVSLTVLKPSRSMNSTQMLRPQRRMAAERLLQLLAEQQPVAEAGQDVVVGQIAVMRLGLLALRDLALQLRLAATRLAVRSWTRARVPAFIGAALAATRAIRLGPLALDLAVDARQRDLEIDRLGDVVVGAASSADTTSSLWLLAVTMITGQRAGECVPRMWRSTSMPSISGIITSSRTRSKGCVASRASASPAIGLDDVKAPTLEAPREDDAIVLDVVDDQQARRSLRLRASRAPCGRATQRQGASWPQIAIGGTRRAPAARHASSCWPAAALLGAHRPARAR